MAPHGDGAVLGQEAGIAPHHLHEEDALVRVGRVANLVHALHDGIQRGVVADGQVGAGEVVVDGAGQAYAGHVVLLGKQAGARERTVTADDHKGVYPVLLHHLEGLLAALGGHKLLAASRLQYGAAATDDAADVLGVELAHLARNQAFVTPIYGHHTHAVGNGRAGDGTDGGIHTRCVAARGQYANSVNLSHSSLYLKNVYL